MSDKMMMYLLGSAAFFLGSILLIFFIGFLVALKQKSDEYCECNKKGGTYIQGKCLDLKVLK